MNTFKIWDRKPVFVAQIGPQIVRTQGGRALCVLPSVRDLLTAMVVWVLAPLILGCSKLLRDSKLQVCQGDVRGSEGSILGRFSCEQVGAPIAWSSGVSFDPLDFRCPSFLFQGVEDGVNGLGRLLVGVRRWSGWPLRYRSWSPSG
jgi:hypothetical protein